MLRACALGIWPDDPARAIGWLHRPHHALFATTPAAAAWRSLALAQYTMWLLECDAARGE